MRVFSALLAVYLGGSAAVSSASVARPLDFQVSQYATLSDEAKMELVDRLTGKQWKSLPDGQKQKVGHACYMQSMNLVGKDGRGKLKVVKEPGAKQILKVAGDYLNSLPPEKVIAHPAAQDLFGDLPKKKVWTSAVVKIDPSAVRWHSTGLYAAPGKMATLVFPDEWVDQGVKVHISGHRDNISAKKNLLRLPSKPSRSFEVTQKRVNVASSFGGAIYIDTGGEPRAGGPFEVVVNTALRAPYFVLRKTDIQQWQSTIRQAPAPYAELVTDRVALSFPSAWIRELDDPTALLEYWDQVVALHDELGGMAHTRRGPERVNVDVQISVGLFHAGYPMQGPQKQCRGVVDLEKLKVKGNWGWFHELGHEAQRRPDKAWGWNNPYTFDGSVEVTVNLFSAHAMDRFKMMDRGGWSWTASPDEVRKRAHKALASKKSYPEMGAGEKLAMYLLLKNKFGWKTISQVLTSYSKDQDTDPKLLPKSNQEKRDAFLVRMSKASGHNLSPYLQELWGIDLSESAVAEVKHLPRWMPDGFDQYING